MKSGLPCGRQVGTTNGTRVLSYREREVLTLCASGMSVDAIAEQLDVAYQTARQYVMRGRKKLGLYGRQSKEQIAIALASAS